MPTKVYSVTLQLLVEDNESSPEKWDWDHLIGDCKLLECKFVEENNNSDFAENA